MTDGFECSEFVIPFKMEEDTMVVASPFPATNKCGLTLQAD